MATVRKHTRTINGKKVEVTRHKRKTPVSSGLTVNATNYNKNLKIKVSQINVINDNTVKIIVVNAKNSSSFNGIRTRMRNAFKTWIKSNDNKKSINWTYISRWNLDRNLNQTTQKERDDMGNNYITFEGTIKIY